MRLWRRRDEPPGIWREAPIIGARWKAGGRKFVLVSISTRCDGITLEYEEESGYRARNIIGHLP